MNPFASATMLGYGQGEILNFIKNFSPNLSKKIEKALALGYSSDEIMKFIGKSFDSSGNSKKDSGPSYETALRVMGDQKPEAVKQAKALRKQRDDDVLSTTLTTGGAGAIGAGIGALAGGPAGAIAGGIGAATGSDDLMKRYEDHIQKGGNLSLTDWLKSILKGGVAGVSAYQASKLLSALQSSEPGKSGIPQDPNGPGGPGELQQSSERVQPPIGGEMEQIQPQGGPSGLGGPVGFTPEQSFKAIKAKGAGNLFEAIASQVDSPGQMTMALEKLYGKGFGKSLETEHGKPSREIIEGAFNFVKQGQAQPSAQEQPASTSTPVAGVDITGEMVLPQFRAKPDAATEAKPITEDVKPLDKGHPDLQKYISEIGKIDTGPRKETKRDIKELQALKSSNVRYADYDEDEQKLQVLFAGTGGKAGEMYEYFDVPREDVDSMMKGSGTAVTTGANSFRAWFGGKNQSIGRAFGDFIKKKDDNGDSVYPYRKVSEKYIRDQDLLKVRGADKIHATTRYVEAFDDLVLKSQAKTRAEGLKMVSETLKEIPDDLLEEMIFEVTKGIGKEIKEGKEEGKKQKRYKGGREKEIRSRVEAKAAEAKRKKGAV